jgi:hypothetical protein
VPVFLHGFQGDIDMGNPTIGPGQTEICRRCVEHLKNDYDHKIADELEKMSLPSVVTIDGQGTWATIIDLLRLRRGQRNGRTDAEKGLI